MKKTIKRIVIDESVSAPRWERFIDFAKKKGIRVSDHYFIKEKHPGMPDGLILHHLLNKNTLFVTSDMPLHNRVLSRGTKSYYIDNDRITCKPLRGVRLKAETVLTKKDLVLKESYHQPQTKIRSLLMPESPKKLKKLYTRRRRIRSYFGGHDHLGQVAVTVSWKNYGTKILVGVRLRVSSDVGVKALDASESYISDYADPEHRSLLSHCYALITVIRLMLHPVKTLVYYDETNMSGPTKDAEIEQGGPYFTFMNELIGSFNEIEFIASGKGQFIERMRNKLNDLTFFKETNEIVQGDFQDMIKRFSNDYNR